MVKMKCETLADFIRLHHALKFKDDLRLGQRFVNMYIKESFPELFYEGDEYKAVDKIIAWLVQYHYINNDQMVNVLPPTLIERQAILDAH